MRKFDIANRNRHKAEFMLEWTPGRFVTFSPNAGLRWDDYPDDVFNPLGLRWDHSWNAGMEIAAMVQPTLKLMVSYNYEDRKLNVAGGSGGANFNTGNLLGCPTDTTLLNPEKYHRPGLHVAQRHQPALPHIHGGRRLEGHSEPVRPPVRISVCPGERGKYHDPLLCAAFRRRDRRRNQLRRSEHDRNAGDAWSTRRSSTSGSSRRRPIPSSGST